MQCDIGVVGLGVMGSNLALNMERNGFRIAGYDLDAGKAKAFVSGPAAGREVTLAELPDRLMTLLKKPRRVLMMVPAGPAVDSAITHLKEHLEAGDILIDGGNSLFLDTERRSKQLAAEGFQYIGAGISGGEQGALWGPSIMPGGQRDAWEALAPILRAIAAKADDGEPCVEYMGPGGAGHYVKMVHNGIEYAMMQGYAEGFEIMQASRYKLDLGAIANLWMQGSVVRSWLLELTASALKQDPGLDHLQAWVEDSGEGRWTVEESINTAVPAPVIGLSLMMRFRSRQDNSFGARMLAAMRQQFGGHAVKPK